MNLNDNFKEFRWYSAILIIFLLSLIVLGSSTIFDLIIIFITYSVTWVVIRKALSTYGPGKYTSDELQTELKWFGSVIIIFLIFLIIIGSPTLFDLTIAALGFTVVWGLRSVLVKHYFNSSNTTGNIDS